MKSRSWGGDLPLPRRQRLHSGHPGLCPHRGARLSEGDCHYKAPWPAVSRLGLRRSGKNVMVLSEARIHPCAARRDGAKSHPTPRSRPRLRVVGDGDPRRSRRTPRGSSTTARWSSSARSTGGALEVALENSMELAPSTTCPETRWSSCAAASSPAAPGENPIFVGNGFGGDVAESNYMRKSSASTRMPTGGSGRRPTTALLTWLTKPLADRARPTFPAPSPVVRRHHLPACSAPSSAGIYPTTRIACRWRHLRASGITHCTRPKTPIGRAWTGSSTPACPVDHRVQLLPAGREGDAQPSLRHTGEAVGHGRSSSGGGSSSPSIRRPDAPFEYKNPDNLPPDSVP